MQATQGHESSHVALALLPGSFQLSNGNDRAVRAKFLLAAKLGTRTPEQTVCSFLERKIYSTILPKHDPPFEGS